MTKSQADYDNVEKLLRGLSPRKELPWRLALLSMSGAEHADRAFDRRIDTLRLQLRPNPAEMARIVVEAGLIGQAMREPG
jgi:hypothetical protein